MAAILKLRRGSSASPALTDGELFLNYTLGALQYASGSTVFTLLPIDKNTTGNIILDGNITASYVRVTNDITIGGKIFLGDNEASDNIYVQASLSGSLIPSQSNEYDLGSLDRKWRGVYAVSASFDNILLPGSGILSSSNTDFSDYTSSVENRLTNIESTTESLDLRLDVEESKSVILETVTSSFDGRLDNLELDSASQDDRLTNLELTSQSHDDRITQLETDTGSQDNRLDNLELTSASHDDRLGQLESDSGSQDNRLTNLELTSASHDDRLGQLEVDSGSQDNRLTNLELTSASHDDRLDNIELLTSSLDATYEEKASGTHTLVSGSSQIDVNDTQNFTDFSQSVDSRLDSLEDDSHTHLNKANLDTIDQDLSTNSDVTFKTGSFTGNVTINGDLVVLGAATEIATSELTIEDKLITIASGSSNSAEADEAGIEIDGAGASIKWSDGVQSFVINTKVSSSVGFKGDGSELTDIQHGNIDFGGSGIVSGSDQVTQSLDLRYLEINGDSVVSGSSQIVYGDISSLPTNIVSESLDSSTVTFTITDGVVTADLIGGVISGSDQVTQSLDLKYLEINGDDVVSGSSQIVYGDISSLPTNIVSESSDSSTVDFTITDGVITAELIGGVVSGSDQIIESLPTGVVSGSDQVTQSLDLRYLEINGDNVVSGSSFSSGHQGIITASINSESTSVDLGLKETDSPTFSGLSLSTLSELGSGELNALVSGSAGSVGYRILGTAAFLNVSNSIDNDPNVIPTNFAVNQALIDAGAGDITSINSSNLYPASTTGIEHTGAGTTDGSGYYGNVGDVVLTIATGSTHFTEGVVGAITDFSSSVSASLNELSQSAGYINYVTNSVEQLTGIEVADFDNNVAVTFIDGTLKFIFGTPQTPSSINTSLSGFLSDRFNRVEDEYTINGTWNNGGYTLISASLYEGTTLLEQVGVGTSLSHIVTTSGSHTYTLEYTGSSPLDGSIYTTSTTVTGTLSKTNPASPTLTPSETIQLGASGNQIEQGATGSISFTSSSADPSNGWDLIDVTTNVDSPYLIEGVLTGSSSIVITATANYESPDGDNDPNLTTSSNTSRTYTKIRSLRYGASTNTTFNEEELANLALWDSGLGGEIGTIVKGTTNPSGQSVTITWSGDKYHYIVYDSSRSNLSNITSSGFGVFGSFSVTTVGQYKIYKTNTLQAGGAGSSITYTLT